MASLSPMSGTLSFSNAKHLLRRSSYHITKQRIDDFTGMAISAAVDSLFVEVPLTIDEPLDYLTGQHFINSGTESLLGDNDRKNMVKAWWLHEAYSDTSIKHKLMFMLHQYFIIDINNSGNDRQGFDYLALLSHYTFGSYKTLARKMVIDNSMLDYLDGDSNTVSNPNENFAREFLELFTIGKGPQIGAGNYTNYTEDDIVIASRLLSGWKKTDRPMMSDSTYIDLETGIQTGTPNFNKHDETDKVFSSAFGGMTIFGAVNETDMHRELDDFLDMIFNQDETAKSISRRLYRYFVSAKISTEVENDIIVPLANTLRNNDYNLEITVKQLLKSQHFYDADDSVAGDQVIGAIIKSPMELLFPTMSYFQITIPDAVTDTEQHYNKWYKDSIDATIFTLASFPILKPDSVAGYPAYYQEPGYDRNWINASSMIARYSIPEMLIQGKKVITGGDLGGNIKIDLVDFLENGGIISSAYSAETIVTELSNYLFSHPLSAERYSFFLNEIFLEGAPSFDWTLDWIDYQNSGDSSAVKIPLESLFKALLYSQEYQLM
jgi:uncharacterized protein (DUF1800 family)